MFITVPVYFVLRCLDVKEYRNPSHSSVNDCNHYESMMLYKFFMLL
jgi:hypothetical protein